MKGYDGYVTIGTKLDSKGLKSDLKSMESNLGKSMKGLQNTVNKTMGFIKTAIIGAGIALLIRAISKELGNAADRLDTMKNYENVMSNLGISSKDARGSIHQLSEELKGLPTTLNEAAGYVQQFAAKNNNLKASTEIYLGINNAILAGGQSMQVQATAMQQLTKAYAKGKPDADDWYALQIAAPAQLNQVAEAMGYGKNASDKLGQALKSGEITMNDFLLTVAKMNRESVNGFKPFGEQAKNSVSGVKTSFENLKTALVRGLANIMDTIGQSNIAGFFDSIRNAIDKVIPKIQAFIKVIVGIVSYIAGLFGKKAKKDTDDTANSIGGVGSAVSDVNDELQGAGGSAAKLNKELKQLAGFDEMNVLQDNKSTSGGSGGGSSSGGGGSLDLSGMDFGSFDDFETKIKDFIFNGEWYKIGEMISDGLINALTKIRDTIRNIPWSDIGSAISQILENIDFSGILVGLVEVFGEAVLGLQDLLLNINWPEILHNLSVGIRDAIFRIDDYIKEIRWADIGKMISDSFNEIDWAGLGNSIITTIWDTLSGLGTLLANIDWGKVGETLYNTLISWIDTLIKKVEETDWKKVGETIGTKVMDFIGNIDWGQLLLKILEYISKNFESSAKGLSGLVDGIVKWFQKPENLEKFKQIGINLLKALFEGMIMSIPGIGPLIMMLINKVKEKLGIHSPSTVFMEIGKMLIEGLIQGIQSLFNNVINIFVNMWNGIKNVFNSVKTFFTDKFNDAWKGIQNVFKNVGTFFGGIWNTIKSKFTNIGQKIGDAVGGAFRGAVNAVLRTIENVLNTPIRGINTLISTINKLPGVKLSKLSTFSLPRLATGAIINQPGRGVPVGGAIAGEAGREGILPLTDSRAMAELGREIGRWITINANIPVSIGNRQIAREVRQLMAQDDFAMNN